jgi:hypothetical protein
VLRLLGAVLMEQTDEWAEQRRYMGLEILAKARRSNPPLDNPRRSRSDHRVSSQRSRSAVFIHHERGRGLSGTHRPLVGRRGRFNEAINRTRRPGILELSEPNLWRLPRPAGRVMQPGTPAAINHQGSLHEPVLSRRQAEQVALKLRLTTSGAGVAAGPGGLGAPPAQERLASRARAHQQFHPSPRAADALAPQLRVHLASPSCGRSRRGPA